MQKPKIPSNETNRVADLKSYQILDTSEQIEYDEITLLASTICKTPIALVSLIDEDRQWFKSRYGLDATETPRDISFCGHAINENELFEVNNSLEDKRFKDNPLVINDPRVIFYAGHPLTSKQGYNLGTLCVIDHKPRFLDADQKKALKVLAKHVVTQMELENSNRKLSNSLLKIQSQKKEFIENAKLRSLGIMAGGIAHEINNPLCIISLCSAHMQRALNKDKINKNELIKNTETINGTVKRIEGIIHALKNISRDSSKDSATNIELKYVLDDVLMLSQHKAKKSDITIDLDPQKFDFKVFFNSGQLAQVLLNLISNSIDAIEQLQERWIILKVVEEDEYITISCVDSGKGIEKSHIENLMDPFFTTKEPGKGTGLGLSISQTIMNRGHGKLIYDEKSLNTKFDVSIPKTKI